MGSRRCQVWGAGRVRVVGSLRRLSVGTRMEPWQTVGSGSPRGAGTSPRRSEDTLMQQAWLSPLLLSQASAPRHGALDAWVWACVEIQVALQQQELNACLESREKM